MSVQAFEPFITIKDYGYHETRTHVPNIRSIIIEVSDEFKHKIIRLHQFIINMILTCGLCSMFILIHKALGNWLLVVFSGVLFVLILLIAFLFPVFSKIFNKFEPLPDGELRGRLCELLEKNNCTVKEIKVMDGSKRSSKANAYFTGYGKMKTIVLYDTLLEQMTADEIVAVFAHEMGHNKHKDTLKMQLMNIVNVVVMVLIACCLPCGAV